MTTIATGGFSTMDGSVGAFANPAVEWIVIAGMVAGALPFVLYIQLMRRRRARLLGRQPGPGLSRHTGRLDRRPHRGACAGQFRGPARGAAAGGLQRHFLHDRNRLCDRRFRRLGRVCAGGALLPDVHRRLRRFDDLRAQGLPPASAVRGGAGPDRPAAAPARRLCAPLCRQADPGGGGGLGDELRVPLRRLLRRH